MHLIDTIKNFKKNIKRTIFTTPGHSQGKVIPTNVQKLLGKRVFESDFSEIEGFDNIRHPQSILVESQKKAAEIYGAKESFYLYNGSSSGIIASMLACVKEGEKVLIARNAHVSVFNALVLNGAIPVWIETEWNNEWDIPGAVEPEKVKEALDNDKEIKALFITSPTYEGIASNIHDIAGICKERNVILIADEAHGALWNFSRSLPTPTIIQGADASVQSLHKTASALTQGAILHLSLYSKINSQKLQSTLNLINSTSPSYPILASVEGCIEYLESRVGKKKIEKLINNVQKFVKDIESHKRISVLPNDDMTKIFVKIEGLSGYKLSSILMEIYNIEDELCNSIGTLFITGIGTDYKKLKKLKNALIDIADMNYVNESEESCKYIMPQLAFTPRKACFMESIEVPISKSIGKVCAEQIIPYPPGIPVLMPGEVIKKEHLKHIKDMEKIAVLVEK